MKYLEVLSQLLNVLFGGEPDESLSSRAGREKPEWAARIDHLLGKGHSARVTAGTKARQQKRWA